MKVLSEAWSVGSGQGLFFSVLPKRKKGQCPKNRAKMANVFSKRKNVLPVQRLSEQLMCGVACQLKLVCGGGFGSTGQE